MLEDDFNDCIGKALKGLGLSISQLGHLSGISEQQITACLNGKYDRKLIHTIAPFLKLNTEKLLGLQHYEPSKHEIPGLLQVVSPFGHLGVNAYIVKTSNTTLVFDTGTESSELHRLAPHPNHLFITHCHRDHDAGIKQFNHCPIILPEDMPHGDSMQYNELTVNSINVDGHCSPARAYLIHGLLKPICIVGDSIFAGSVGGFPDNLSYNTGIENISNNLLSLPPETILCPGHGPLTTVKEEIHCNPFF